MTDKLLEEAKWVIILFDQANTNQAIERLGSRGELLKDGIEDLRREMIKLGIDPYKTEDSGKWREGYRVREIGA